LSGPLAVTASADNHSDRPTPARAGEEAERSSASKQSLRGLDWLNFFLADVQSGVGPFLAIYLAGSGWNEQTIGIVLTGGGIAGIIAQTPAGALADRVRSKRALVAGGVVALALGALLIAVHPAFWPVMAAQTLIGHRGTTPVRPAPRPEPNLQLRR
jgi:predicted MFS family arabinose efflux permease